MQWQYTQEIINQIKNMFRTRWAAATQESKQRFKPLLNEPCPPRYSEQQDSLRCYLDPNDLIRDNRKMGYEIRQLPAFFILQTYSRDFQKHLLRNSGPAPLCRFMVHDDDVLDYVDRGELLRKFHDFEVRNFTVEFTSLFLLRTFGPFFLRKMFRTYLEFAKMLEDSAENHKRSRTLIQEILWTVQIYLGSVLGIMGALPDDPASLPSSARPDLPSPQ